jgi:hypothetical protein
MGGCNRGHSFADSNVQVHIESIQLSERYSHCPKLAY